MCCRLNLPRYMLNMPSRIRQEKLAIAQSRAMEEQRERENPLARRGAGATPSMGLSQYRGGMESESDDEVGGIIRTRMSGKGTKKGAVRKTARRAYEPKSMDEATAMGLHLAKHLHGLHGDDFVQKFGAGIVGGAMMCGQKGMSGGSFWDDIQHAFSDEVWNPQKNGVAQAFNDFGQSVKQEFVDPNSTLRGQILPGAAKVMSGLTAIPGVGEVLAPITGLVDAAQAANQAAKSVGLGKKKGKGKLVITHGGAKTGAYEGEGVAEDAIAKFQKARKPKAESFIEHERRMTQTADIPTYSMKGEGWWDDIKSAAKGVAQQVIADPVGSFEKAKKGYEIGKQVYDTVKGKGGKKRRAPAGPHDGRRKRAEVVKKVMAEKGLSMIEASKYVKAHGLY